MSKEPSVEFPWDEVDKSSEWHPDSTHFHFAADMVAAVLRLIQASKRPLLELDRLFYILGFHEFQRFTACQLAAKHGISKQAFTKGCTQIIKAVGLRPCGPLRNEEARKHMRQHNKRHANHDDQ